MSVAADPPSVTLIRPAPSETIGLVERAVDAVDKSSSRALTSSKTRSPTVSRGASPYKQGPQGWPLSLPEI